MFSDERDPNIADHGYDLLGNVPPCAADDEAAYGDSLTRRRLLAEAFRSAADGTIRKALRRIPSRMPRLRVFLSSTATDLVEHRAVADDTL